MQILEETVGTVMILNLKEVFKFEHILFYIMHLNKLSN